MKKRIIAAASAFFLVINSSCSIKKENTDVLSGMKKTGSMELYYADQFKVDYYEDGFSHIIIGDDEFLLVPEGEDAPEDTGDITILRQPIDNIYAASSSSVDLFDGFGELDRIKMISTAKKDWCLPSVTEALENEDISYIGKYSAPDYEALIENDCDFVLENSMIWHTPEVKEQIERLDIPVMVELSSYESHPLGRMEWMRLYGLLLGKSKEADEYFKKKSDLFESAVADEIPDNERKTAAFFSVSPNGYINTRKPGDYISKMIELAGGKYIFTGKDLNVDDNAMSTINIQVETFYESAKDADYLIYNSTVDGRLGSMEQLLEKCSILKDFKAVKEGNVWCTEQNMFQQTTGAADMILDLHTIFMGEANDNEQLSYLHRLK